jgi:protocatechuate 3,4-dioxygenase beta subunit
LPSQISGTLLVGVDEVEDAQERYAFDVRLTLDQGAFTIPTITPGGYRLRLDSPTLVAGSPVHDPCREKTDLGTLAPVRSTVWTGVVTDINGQPIEGALLGPVSDFGLERRRTTSAP